MNLDGTILNKQSPVAIPLYVGNGGSYMAVTIFPNEKAQGKRVEFQLGGRSYSWSIPDHIKFDTPGIYYYNLFFTADSCYVSEVDSKRAYIYVVGSDYPNAQNKKRVVYALDDTGKHGKIVGYFKKKQLQLTKQFLGATDFGDGMANTLKLYHTINFLILDMNRYFGQSHKQMSWYIPAINELIEVAQSGVLPDNLYWSSTETSVSDGLIYDSKRCKIEAQPKDREAMAIAITTF